MRANEFTFKKTKRTVTKHHGLCIDLTVNDAKNLVSALEFGFEYVESNDSMTSEETLVSDLLERLNAFVAKHDK